MSIEQSTLGSTGSTDRLELREEPPIIPRDWRSPEALRYLLVEKNWACRHVEYVYEAPLDASPDDVDGRLVEKVARSYGIPREEWGCRLPSGRPRQYFNGALAEKREAVR